MGKQTRRDFMKKVAGGVTIVGIAAATGSQVQVDHGSSIHVFSAETGEEIHNVVSIDIDPIRPTGFVTCRIEVAHEFTNRGLVREVFATDVVRLELNMDTKGVLWKRGKRQ